MSVSFNQDGCFELKTESGAILLSAVEIYAVVYEGQSVLHEVAVSKDDFYSLGIKFSEYPIDLIIVLQSRIQDGKPQISAEFRASNGRREVELIKHRDRWLGYVVLDKVWTPLPLEAEVEAENWLRSLSIDPFSPISLSQYMRLVRLKNTPVKVEDRTEHELSALALSSVLRGDIPEGFLGKLYDYQADGYHWLSFMIQNQLGAIIADEMGLGKTIQVICLLCELRNKGQVPHLVLAPATLLENWRREILRFAPDLKVLVHSGPRRSGYAGILAEQDVVVSSLDTAVSDVALFRGVDWNLVVIDEAQNIKNPSAKRSIKLKTIPRKGAIAVTGTPVENCLKDLWSITDFVLPSFLGSLSEFEARHPDTATGAALLEPAVAPIILRRRVKDVAKDLPERIDIPLPVELSEEESLAYESLRLSAKAGGAGLAALTSLRMFCTHPWLADQFKQLTDPAECSAKLRRLLEIIDEVTGNGRKALIFTSYSESLDLICHEVSNRFSVYTDFIDGRVPVPQRQAKVDAFTSLNGPGVLVLNPKAAGVGLNITAASYVIHFNLEWNPAVEDQASARAYRRGQTNTVMVYRLFYAGTVEEVINERMSHKRELAEIAVSGTDGKDQEMNDLLRALNISPVNR